jgi:hypothetical protein
MRLKLRVNELAWTVELSVLVVVWLAGAGSSVNRLSLIRPLMGRVAPARLYLGLVLASCFAA